MLVVLAVSAVACTSPTSPSPPGDRLPAVGVGCPAEVSPSRTKFHPRPGRDGVVYDLEVPEGWTGARVVRAGDLALPSGRLIAASGGEMAYPLELRPVDLGVDGGSYPVNLLIARFDSGDRRVAFAEIVLRDEPIVRWAGSAALSFGTDGGDGGYISAEASRYAGTGDGQWLFEAIERAAALPTFPLCEQVRFPERAPANVIMFQTGWGDGFYPTAIGYDAGGRPSAVVTFCLVIPWRLAGLPGTPPRQVLDEERRRGR
jgi:hypothetical protein